ncbi:MAG TPA: O-antigen ligase family protein [Bryobacteraceae bacterium]|nr:O-antigen ligase family protein [Bryobacteraceae bacterium]
MGMAPAALAAIIFFGILTLWVPAYYPIAVFQAATFALASVAAWRGRHSLPRFAWPAVPFACGVLWGVIQWISGHTAYGFQTRLAILKWAAFLCVFLLGTSWFREAGTRHRFLSAMLWFGFLLSILATVQSFSAKGRVFWLFETPYTDFVMGPMLSSNDYAAFIEALLPAALYEAMCRRRGTLLHSTMAAVMYASVIVSASRAGVALTTAEMVLVPLLVWVRREPIGASTGVRSLRIAILVVVLVAVVGAGPLWNRILEPDPMAGRREFAQSSWQMAISHPWMGVGLGTWSTVYPAYALVDLGMTVNEAHDDWLQWTAEGGFPFGVMMVSLFLWSLRPAFRSVWGLGVIAVFLHALVDYPFARPALGAWPILVLSMIAASEGGRKHVGRP